VEVQRKPVLISSSRLFPKKLRGVSLRRVTASGGAFWAVCRQTGSYHDSDNQRGAALAEDSFSPIRTSRSYIVGVRFHSKKESPVQKRFLQTGVHFFVDIDFFRRRCHSRERADERSAAWGSLCPIF
jgi:hypothetical protein